MFKSCAPAAWTSILFISPPHCKRLHRESRVPNSLENQLSNLFLRTTFRFWFRNGSRLSFLREDIAAKGTCLFCLSLARALDHCGIDYMSSSKATRQGPARARALARQQAAEAPESSTAWLKGSHEAIALHPEWQQASRCGSCGARCSPELLILSF